jgi:uncharacterized membrane protein YccF (DUF307 family)
MSKTRLIAVISAVLFLRWLAVGHLTLTVAGATISVPALAVAAVAVLAVAAAAVALVVYRVRAERAMLAAWQARTVAAR